MSTAHQYWTAKECACGADHCPICEGGLAVCKVCGLAEGELTTECPGVPSCEHSEAICAGLKDFRDGAWWEKPVLTPHADSA